MTDSGSRRPPYDDAEEPPPGYPRRPAPPPAYEPPVTNEPAPAGYEQPPTYEAAPAGYEQPPTYEPPTYEPPATNEPAPYESPPAYEPPASPPPARPVPPPRWPPPPPPPPDRPPVGPPGASPPGAQYPPQPPGYGPSYEQAPPWGPGPATPAVAPQARRPPPFSQVASPVLASLALSAGVVVLFVADLFVALGEPTGTPANLRLLQFLAPTDVAVAAILVVAVALVALRPDSSPVPAPAVVSARSTAGAVAGFVALGAFVRAITVLTIGHQHAAVKIGNLLDALAALLVALVAISWAFRDRVERI
jgi:hypothetical protein